MSFQHGCEGRGTIAKWKETSELQQEPANVNLCMFFGINLLYHELVFDNMPKLLAFIVGDLRYIESNAFRLPVRVYATPGNEKHGHFSLELAAKTLKFYEETFDSKFPLPKMDMVAIPDFSAGAMENWGLITYRVVDLLFDETTSGANTKQRVAEGT